MTLKITDRAKKDIFQLDKKIQARILKAIQKFSHSPETADVKKIRTLKNHWRLRIGDFRIIIRVDKINKVFMIQEVKHRKDAYK